MKTTHVKRIKLKSAGFRSEVELEFKQYDDGSILIDVLGAHGDWFVPSDRQTTQIAEMFVIGEDKIAKRVRNNG